MVGLDVGVGGGTTGIKPWLLDDLEISIDGACGCEGTTSSTGAANTLGGMCVAAAGFG